jgi:hypothetical protein
MAEEDRRSPERLDILGELHGEVMIFQPMTLTEIGPAGAQVEAPFPLQLDSLHDFRFSLGPKSIVVKGRIAHCRISDVDQERVIYRTGVEFIDLPVRVSDAIVEFVETIKAGRKAVR